MSAIYGILRFDGDAVAASDLERMGNALRHRGPDGRRSTRLGAVGLGHGLMRVTGEDALEAQPVRGRGLTLVADARLDNREALGERLSLAADDLAAMPDSALLFRAFATWGEACVDEIVGDFAFAVWDAAAGRLTLVRDHMGQRNLFYHRGDRFFAFASEIGALWALADVPRELLDEEIARFFHRTADRRPEGRTLYSGVEAVPGGSIVAIGADGRLERRRYWEPGADPAHEARDEAYYVHAYRRVLGEAVACRLRRLRGPAALLMSAGFDTAAIAGLAGPVVTAQGRKLVSLSWLGGEDGRLAGGDLRPWLEACRRVMPHLDIRELRGEPRDPLDGVERVFGAFGGPGPGSRRTLDLLYANATAAGARLVMDGFGGDYTLNPRGAGALARLARRGRLGRLASEVRARSRTGRVPIWRVFAFEVLAMQAPRALTRWQRRLRGAGNDARLEAALREVEGPRLKTLRRRSARGAPPGREAIPASRMRDAIRHAALSISRSQQAGGSIAAASHGLDLTRPFHDKRVVELALAVPEDLYVRNGLNRYLARQALADLYPPELQTRGNANEGALIDQAILDLDSPGLAAEAARCGRIERFAGYFDFDRVARNLAAPGVSARKHAAVRALLTVRFIEWFAGSNAG